MLAIVKFNSCFLLGFYFLSALVEKGLKVLSRRFRLDCTFPQERRAAIGEFDTILSPGRCRVPHHSKLL